MAELKKNKTGAHAAYFILAVIDLILKRRFF
jgi:hypothetical protein